jgi:hypothetical protein
MVVLLKIIPKKIDLKGVTQIKKFASEYVLNTKKTELRVNTEIIEEGSLPKLRVILEKLVLK